MSYIDVIVSGPIGNIPKGGTPGQALTKNSNLDFDYSWVDIEGVTSISWSNVTAKPEAISNTTAAFTTEQALKLGEIEDGATANSTDAQLRDRSTHTGTQPSSTIVDFSESVQDLVASLLVAGDNITLTYNDVANTLTIDAAGGGGGGGGANLSVTNKTSASLDIASDSGTDATIPSATTELAGLITAEDQAKLDGIEDEATANSSDEYLLDRVNHTGTQTVSTISDFDTAVASAIASGITGKEDSITAGTTSQYWRGDKSWQTLDPSAVGLGNVDNTSDSTKNSAVATLTNKTISGSNNTLSNIAQSSVTNLVADLASKQPLIHVGTTPPEDPEEGTLWFDIS